MWPNISDFSIAYILVAAAQMPFILSEEAKEVYGINASETKHVEAHADAMIELFFNHQAPPE